MIWSIQEEGFPGGSVVENPPAHTGDMGFIPAWGRPPHAVPLNYWACERRMLSPCAAAAKDWAPTACVLQQEKPLQRAACPVQLESSPHSRQLEKKPWQQWRPDTSKNKQNYIKEDMHRYRICKVYALYIKNLNILRFWYLWGVLEPTPCGYWGMTTLIFVCFNFLMWNVPNIHKSSKNNNKSHLPITQLQLLSIHGF